MTARYDLLIFEQFTYQGKTRHKAHKVGSAKRAKDGFMLFIPPGVSITSRVMMVPEKTALSEVDLLEAYESAADSYGL